MAVRIVAAGDTTTPPPPVHTVPDGATRRRQRLRWTLLTFGMVILVVSLLVIGYALVRPRPTTAAATGGPSTSGTAKPSATTTAGMPEGAASPTGVEGMWWGYATVAAGNTDQTFGIPCGWEHTPEGAAAAAMTVAGAVANIAFLVDDTRPIATARLYTTDGAKGMFNAAGAAELRKRYRLDENGVVLLSNGQASTWEHFYGVGMARYGAYKLITVNPDYVVVEAWVPYVIGPGTDDNLTDVRLSGNHVQLAMRWGDGPGGMDWRVAATTGLEWKKPTGKSNIGLAAMKDLIGTGWLIPADATEQPYPGAVMAK